MPVNTTALRAICWSLLYGADKIPDKWFEKVPGGYYKQDEKRSGTKKNTKRDSRRRSESRHRRSSRSPSDDGYRSEGAGQRRSRNRRQSYYDEEDGDDDRRDGRNRGRNPGAANGRFEDQGHDGTNGQSRAHNPAGSPPEDGQWYEYHTGQQQSAGRYAPVSTLYDLELATNSAADIVVPSTA